MNPFGKFASAGLGRFARDRSGAIAVTGAIFAVSAIGFAAIVADWGSLYLARRNQQGVTDLAALVAARNLDQASAAATAVLAANGVVPRGPLTVTVGSYTANASLEPRQRFVAGGAPSNAVRLSVPAEAPLFFGRALTGEESMAVVTTATAARTAVTAFTIGSRLASLEGGALNKLLGALMGGNLSLSLMDYNALATAEVGAVPFLKALATRSGATIGTYSDLANTTVSVGDVLNAMADAGLAGPSASTAAAAISTMLLHSNAASAYLDAGKLIDLGPYASLGIGDGSALAAKLRALPLVSAAAVAANGTNQVAADLAATVPGLLGLTATVTIGERPQSSAAFRVGEDGTTVYTAQTRIRLEASVAGIGLGGTPTISVPILVDVASASARVASLECGDNPSTDANVRIDALPSAADLWIGEPISGWSTFSAKPVVGPAQIVSVAGIANVSASGHLAISNINETPLDFSWSDIQGNTIKSVSTTTPVTSLVASLIGQTNFSASAIGLTLPLLTAATKNTVATLVAPIGPAVDPILLSILDALGVRIGEADVTVNGLRCDGSVLVN